jgi:hypothetical protein
MSTVYAWFSAETALRRGSTLFRKEDGSTVNVTRLNAEREAKGSYNQDERYVGEVVCAADGGCVRANRRVGGITR